MHFMVDFENVRSGGLRGATLLRSDDGVTIFYSKSCDNIEIGAWHELEQSHCTIKLCKLEKSGKNALDFYIASRIGEEYGGSYEGVTAIVSADGGFQAVRDYWRRLGSGRQQIVLGRTIEDAIKANYQNDERGKQVQRLKTPVSLEANFAKYEEKMRIQQAIRERLLGTEYEDRLNEIGQMVEEKLSHKILYLNSLKSFGRADGLGIYRRLKDVV